MNYDGSIGFSDGSDGVAAKVDARRARLREVVEFGREQRDSVRTESRAGLLGVRRQYRRPLSSVSRLSVARLARQL